MLAQQCRPAISMGSLSEAAAVLSWPSCYCIGTQIHVKSVRTGMPICKSLVKLLVACNQLLVELVHKSNVT